MNTVLKVGGVQEVLRIKSFKIKDNDGITSQLKFRIKKNKAGIQKIVIEGTKDGINDLANDLENDWVILAKLFYNMENSTIKYGDEEFKVKIYKKFKCTVSLEQYEQLKCRYDILKAIDESHILNMKDLLSKKPLDTLELADIFNAIDIVSEKQKELETNLEEIAETEEISETEDKKDSEEKTDSEELDYKSLGFIDTSDMDCGYDVINRKRLEKLNGHSSNSGEVL